MIALPFLILLILGVWFAKRWLINSPPALQKYPRGLRVTALILSCWIGSFMASSVSRQIGYTMSDGIAYDEGMEVPYNVIHDGSGDNATCLFLGWIVGPVCWMIAGVFLTKRAADNDHANSRTN